MSNFLISKIGIGSAQFGMKYGISNAKGQTSIEEVNKILSVCATCGIKYVDTAAAYGNAEEVLGMNDLHEFNVITKFMYYPEKGIIQKQMNESLQKLNINKAYALLAHRPIYLLSNNYHWDELVHLKEVGKVGKIGFSLNSVDELNQLLDKKLFPDIIQIPYNYLDNRFESIAIDLKKQGCEIHSRSAFLQGLFFKKVEELDSFFDEIKPILISIKENAGSLEGALLHYVLTKHFIDVVIIGVENSIQLLNNLHAVKNQELLLPLNLNISEKIQNPSMWPKNN